MKALTFLKGIGVGAGLMYFCDPQLGRRRRKQVADQFQHSLCELSHTADVAWRDANNRLQGCMAELRSSVQQHDNSDGVVHDRVRAKLGRYVSHPSAIGVTVSDGLVTLRGPILAQEVEPLVHCLRGIHGVRGVENQLDDHETAGNVAALQGGRPRPGETYDIFQNTWSPSTRCLIGSLGGAMLLSSASSRGLMSLVKGATAACMIASAMSHRPHRNRAQQHGPPAGGGDMRHHNGGPRAGRTSEEATEPASSERESTGAAGLQARSGPT